MNKIAGLTLIGIVLLISFGAKAQTYAESALLFSRIKPGGSARIQGMGGAQVSLGGDYSSSISNPAGLGMYNRSEFTISPGVFSSSATSTFLGNEETAKKSTFEIPGLSLVIHTDKPGAPGGFLGGSFAISYNRLNDFNRSFSYSGVNSKNSIIDYFIQDATGFDPSTLLPGGNYSNTPTALAYNNFLIEDSTFIRPGASNKDYMSVLGTYGPGDVRRVLQEENVTTSGAQNQVSFSYGANFSDKVFIGAGIGIASIRYQSNKTYRESNFLFESDPTYRPMDNMVLNEYLKSYGTGINATLGIIYRPINRVQLGFSYNSPTVYSMTDNYSAVMSSQWNNFDYNGDGSVMLNDEGPYQTDNVVSEYILTTPSRINGGITFFIGKLGLITGDVEYVNYPGANYSSSTGGVSYNSDNEKIKGLYRSTFNYRVGGELRYSNFRFRGGFSYMGDPFIDTQNGISGEVIGVSGGIGYRTKTFYVDLAGIVSSSKGTYRPYTVFTPDSPVVSQKYGSTMIMATIGFPF